MVITRNETPADADAVKQLLGLGFAPEHATRNIWQLRNGAPVAALCLVAEAGGAGKSGEASHAPHLLASIRYWPLLIAGVDALLLGPLAVDPAMRGRGIGKRLVRESLALARDTGTWRLCFVSGEPGYYPEFGFRKIAAADIILPAPIEEERLHMLDFGDGSFAGMPPKPWKITGV